MKKPSHAGGAFTPEGCWKSVLALLPVLMLLASPGVSSAPRTQSDFSTGKELMEDLEAVPCKDGDRLSAVKSLFEKMGVPASDFSIETLKGVSNLVVTRRGASAEKIVVGAHYDKVSKGCGAIDNWTGIVAIAHIYKALKTVPLNKTLVFVAFGKEEEGLLGSKAWVDALSKEELSRCCAMVNIDSLGMGIAQVADNMSSKSLEQLTADLAEKMNIKYAHAPIPRGASDSNSFLAKKIPALTIHSMTSDWPSVLHSTNDQASRVNSTSLYLSYRLALAVVYAIDKAKCGSY